MIAPTLQIGLSHAADESNLRPWEFMTAVMVFAIFADRWNGSYRSHDAACNQQDQGFNLSAALHLHRSMRKQ